MRALSGPRTESDRVLPSHDVPGIADAPFLPNGDLKGTWDSSNNRKIEKRLWAAADELRANSKLKSSEYSTPLLGLIFLRYADDHFAHAQQELTTAQEAEVKEIVGERVAKLKADKLVLNWRVREQTRAGVRLTIEEMPDDLLGVYDRPLYGRRCNPLYLHVYDSYYGSGQSG
jgi:hypothetical protein